MATYFTYPDFEKIFCEYAPEILENIGLSDFRVATKKLRDSSSAPSVEIIVRSDGGPVQDYFLYNGYTIYIWVKDSSENTAYAKANQIAELVAVCCTLLSKISSNQLKVAERPLISSVENEGETQVRNIVGEVLLVPLEQSYSPI